MHPVQPCGLRSLHSKKRVHVAGNPPAACVHHRTTTAVLHEPSTPLRPVLLLSCGAGADASGKATAKDNSPARRLKPTTTGASSTAASSATGKAGSTSAQQGKPRPAAKAKATSPPRNYGKGKAATSPKKATSSTGKAGSSANTDGAGAGSFSKAAGKDVVWKMGRILADVLVLVILPNTNMCL